MSAFVNTDSVTPFHVRPSLVVLGVLAVYTLWRMWRFLSKPLFSPIRKINGPPGTSFLFGSMRSLVDGRAYEMLCEWKQQYGHVFAVRAIFSDWRLVTTDNKAISHMLQNNMIYYKPEPARFHLSYIIGNGLVSAEGMEHRHQRRIMTPAFSPGHLRDILPTFLSKAQEMRDVLLEQLTSTPTNASTPSNRVDILHYLYLATLDIIGLAGFNYDFQTLRHGEEGNELSATLNKVNNPKNFPLFLFMKGFAPVLRIIEFDPHAIQARKLRGIVRRIGMALIEQGQREAIHEKASAGGTALETSSHDKDLLSLMVKANMSKTVPLEQRLSVEQMLNQIPTFLIAGHETTANSTAWGIYALSQRPVIQNRLRAELQEAFPDDSAPITLEALNGLTYLDAVVREILRYHPPVEISARQAQVDDILPLEKGFIDRAGNFKDQIEVKKGDYILIPIMVINRMKELWGEDADEFNPDRWLGDLPSATSGIPGVWANQLTFLGGPRSCIGFKFAILETKALLFYLIRAFEFELAVNPEDIIRKEMIVSRPYVKDDKQTGAQMPVVIRPVKGA